MIYKKIRDKVPSLSSLLLAGVALCATNCPTENKSNSSQNPETVDTNKHEKVNEDNAGVFDSRHNKAVLDILKALMNAVGFDCLEGATRPQLIRDEEVKDDKAEQAEELRGKPLQEKLVKLCKDFSTNKFYSSLFDDQFSDMNKLKFRTGYSKTGLTDKAAWALALDHLARPVRGLYDILIETNQKFTQGVHYHNIKQDVLKSVERLQALLDSGDSQFKSGGSFFPPEEAKFSSTGEELFSFLTGKSKDPKKNAKQAAYHVNNLLTEPCGDGVLLIGKLDTRECHDGATLDYLAERGSGISDTMKLAEGGAQMPAISKINNKVAKLLDKDKFTFSDGSPAAKGNEFLVEGALNFGTLLFTLFRGEGALDFIKISKVSDGVKLTASDKEFQEVNSAVIDSRSKFAQVLGAHIAKCMPDIFYIPDVDKLKNEILTDSVKNFAASDKDEVMTCDSESTSASYKDGKAIGMLHELYKNILAKLNISATDIQSFDAKALEKKVKDIRNMVKGASTSGGAPEGSKPDDSKPDDSKPKDFAYAAIKPEHRIYYKFIANLLDAIASMKKTITKADLISEINSSIDKVLNQAILIKEGSVYKETFVSAKLYDKLGQFSQVLSKRNHAKGVNYNSVKSELKKANNNTDTTFDVDKIKESFIEKLGLLKSIFSLDVPFALDMEGDITKNEFSIKELKSSDFKVINKIKHEYKEQVKQKAVAPKAPAPKATAPESEPEATAPAAG